MCLLLSFELTAQTLNKTTKGTVSTSKPIKSQPYYEEIFSKAVRKQLAKADKYTSKGDSKMEKALKYEKEIEGYQTIILESKNEKNIARAKKSIVKLEAKALKNKIHAMEYYEKANVLKYDTYKNNFSTIRTKASTKNQSLGKTIEKEAETNIAAAIAKRKTVDKGIISGTNYIRMTEANELELKAITSQEEACHLYATGKTGDFDNEQSSLNKEEETDKYHNKYWSVRETKLYPKLNLSDTEYNEIYELNLTNEKANTSLAQLDSVAILIESIEEKANNSPNTTLKKSYLLQIENLKRSANVLNYEANIQHITVNQKKYKFYKEKYAKNRPTNDAKRLALGKEYEAIADSLSELSLKQIAAAKKMSDTTQMNLKLVQAKENQLMSIENQESALACYLKINSMYNYKRLSEPVEEDIDKPANTTAATEKVVDSDKTETKYSEIIINDYEKPTLNEVDFSTNDISKDKKVIKEKVEKDAKKIEISDTSLLNLLKTNDLIFKIRFGILKTVSDSLFGKNYLITSQKLKSELSIFYVGNFSSHEGAAQLLPTVKTKYKDAYIVAFLGDKQLTLAKAKNLIQQYDTIAKAKYETEANNEVAAIKNGSYSDFINESKVEYLGGEEGTQWARGINIANTKGTIYTVQLGAFSKPVLKEVFAELQPLYAEKLKSGIIKYSYGKFDTYSSAKAAKVIADSKGFTESYIAEYKDGKRNSVIENEATVNETKVTAQTTTAKSIPTYVGSSDTSGKYVRAINVETVPGLFYTIQLGTFASDVEAGKFKDFNPIYGQETKTGKTKFFTGYYIDYTGATLAKNDAVTYGFTDAYIVAFLDGEIISTAKAKQKQAELGIVPTVTENDKTSVGTYKYSKNEVQAINITSTKNVFYTIQLGTFYSPVDLEKFAFLNPIYGEELKSGAIKYLAGQFDNYADAQKAKASVIELGIQDAYITAYSEGKNIDVAKAEKLIAAGAKTSSKTLTVPLSETQNSTSEVKFMVQIAIFDKATDVTELKQKLNIPAFLTVDNYTLKNGKIIYAIGSYTNYSEALERKNELKGIEVEGFVIALQDNRKIDVEAAKKLVK